MSQTSNIRLLGIVQILRLRLTKSKQKKKLFKRFINYILANYY